MVMTTLSIPLALAATSSAAGFALVEDLSREASTTACLPDRATSDGWLEGNALAEVRPASKAAALAVMAKRLCRLRK